MGRATEPADDLVKLENLRRFADAENWTVAERRTCVPWRIGVKRSAWLLVV